MKTARILLVISAVLLLAAGIAAAVLNGSGFGATDKAMVYDDPPTPIERITETFSTSSIGWGIGPAKNDAGQPVDSANAQQKYGGLGAVFLNGSSEKQICLTYDLGYENGYTEKILDALKEKNVKAVFFITSDYLKSAPQIVERIIKEGHVLGNHSVHHYSMPTISDEQAKTEVMQLHDEVKSRFGYTMKLFRFPKGEFSEHALSVVDSLNYQSWFWSFAYCDWLTDRQPDPAASLEKIVSAAHPGAIYLLHAVSSTNAAIMGDIIDRLTAEGYTFTVPQV